MKSLLEEGGRELFPDNESLTSHLLGDNYTANESLNISYLNTSDFYCAVMASTSAKISHKIFVHSSLIFVIIGKRSNEKY